MERNAYFDNAKLILIFLVVFGHIIQPFTNDAAGVNTLYLWIYTFHMPAFIFLAGFFAKGSGNLAYIRKLAQKLLIPYLIFQVIYTGYYFLIGKDGWQLEMFYPHWALWFLFSLFSWHMFLILFKKIPAVMGLSIAVGIGLIVGYFGEVGHTFSLSRTFVFFPFFLMGYWITQKQVLFLKRVQLKAAAIVVMLVIAVGIYYAPEFNTGWLLASKSYSTLGLPEYGIIARLLVYVTSAIMAAGFLAWVPEKRSKLTFRGTQTLYVYLLHGFFVQFFRENDMFAVNSVIDLLGLAALSALIVLVLSSRPMRGFWQPVVEGKMSILKARLIPDERKKDKQNLSA
ncbi:Fucose 4-O-acetylase [Lentibacillus persicus]|uniref:Fucose 4-O-acetylase n=1 Tax=Lentibacillus persicus TaxID=640948 RepID=A0A1I1XL62_9BACI|nr:acyltransferase family protein [Lentibacillus persicus]SFE08149.1 Fucose 4-O-acetylase [Lentibacillus persicus]